MKILVGLGNPGARYNHTRHNAGFIVLDSIVGKGDGVWKSSKRNADEASLNLFGEKCLLLKPTCFMNLSGKSVAAAVKFYKVNPADLIIIYDDIDMVSGKVKTKLGGGHGGHNGVRSIIQELGTNDFVRIKIGVGRPDSSCRDADISKWVLDKFCDEELLRIKSHVVDEVLDRIHNHFMRKVR